MSFLQAEKRRQTEWKLKTRSLSRQAKKPGLFGNRLFPFCLPVDYAHENLFADTRERIIEYFLSHDITWHTAALPGSPSNHLCSSQVFLANFLGPFQYDGDGLHSLLQPAFPDLLEVQPIESHDQYLAFEWVPPVDLLGELPKGHRTLTRGMGNTSIDFTVLGRFETGTVELILGEAKYTEHYPTRLVEPIVASKRLSRYTDVLNRVPWVPDVDDEHARQLATEPVFQVFRHHLLAMTLKETFPSIDNVRILHLYVDRGRSAPQESSPVLQSHPGMRILQDSPIPFSEISAQRLLAGIALEARGDLAHWVEYMRERYRL